AQLAVGGTDECANRFHPQRHFRVTPRDPAGPSVQANRFVAAFPIRPWREPPCDHRSPSPSASQPRSCVRRCAAGLSRPMIAPMTRRAPSPRAQASQAPRGGDPMSQEGSAISELVVETRGLGKRFGAVVAVQDLTMGVRRGEISGFLGPNGAGKTTTLRLLLGLARPSAGAATVLGARPGSSRALARTGAMVEAPGLYPFLSGRDNLRVLARHAGAPTERVPTVLGQGGVGDRAGAGVRALLPGDEPAHGSGRGPAEGPRAAAAG